MPTSSLTPWKKTDERSAYRGYRSIVRKTFEMPNGKVEDFDVVDGRPFATIAAFTASREVLIVRQYRPGPEQFHTGFPAGYIDQGESPEAAARRELLEETGYTCEKVIFLKKIMPAYSHVNKLCFLATGCEKVSAPHLDENEFLESTLISLDELRALLRDPEELAFTDVDIAYLALDTLGWL